eukprot:8265943-Pyramimonas_sp.AAC.1
MALPAQGKPDEHPDEHQKRGMLEKMKRLVGLESSRITRTHDLDARALEGRLGTFRAGRGRR